MLSLFGYRSEAVLSDCGRYRYRLTREWDSALPGVCFIMLNPSTADACSDDPTLRRCIAFASAWDYGRLEVVNLFAYRSPQPAALKSVSDPVGPDNDRHIREAVQACDRTVLAWGTHGTFLGREREVLKLVDRPFCLMVTKDGHPQHPLYLPSACTPMEYRR